MWIIYCANVNFPGLVICCSCIGCRQQKTWVECIGTLYCFVNFLKYILLIMLLQLSHFSPFIPLHPAHPLPPAFTPFSSCPWVIHIHSLASPFPILFLTSPYFPPTIYATYSLYIFPLLFPSHSPIDNPPCDLHLYGFVPVLVVCLVCSCFCFRFHC